MATALATVSRPRHTSTPQVMSLRLPRGLAPAGKSKGKHRKRHSGMGGQKAMLMFAVAGFVLGNIDKSGTSFPTVPMLGRAGTAAVALHFLGKGNAMMQQAALAAAAIAGYEFGSTGKVAGPPMRQL